MRKSLPAHFKLIALLTVFNLFVFSSCNKPISYSENTDKDSVLITASKKKVLLITIQGAKGSVMKTANIPNIMALLSSSIYSWDAVCDTVSTDQAGWASLFTGVNIAKSGITGSSYAGNHFAEYPSFLSRLKTNRAQLKTVILNSSSSLNDSLISKTESGAFVTLNNDAEVKDSVVNRLKTDNPDVLMTTFSSVNKAGKQSGFSNSSVAYTNALNTIDGYIGNIINALKARKNYANEDWLIIITSNHGGNNKGEYGGQSAEERNTFVIYSNSQFTSKEIKAPLINVPYDGNYPYFYAENGINHAAYTNNAAYQFGADQSFTVEFNIRTNGSTSDNPIIGNKDWNSGGNPGWVIYLQNGNIRVNYKASNGSRMDLRNGPPVANGKWNHVSVTFDRNNNISFYLNGKFFLNGPSIKDNGDINTSFPLVIGTNGTLTYDGSLNSYLADIRIWKNVLSAKEIADWSYIPITKDHPDFQNLIGWWKANAGPTAVNTIKDYSGTGADLTIKNDLRWDNIVDVLNPSNFDATQFVPKSVDVATNIFAWQGVKINPLWKLDGQVWILGN